MNFEFLKTLLGDAYTEDIDKKVSDEVGKRFVAKSDFDAKNTALETAQAQLTEAGKTIQGFKDMDIDGIKKAAEDYKAAAEKAEKDAADKIAAMQFDQLLDGAITASKGKNSKAIKALLDVDALKISKNQSEDIKSAITALQADNDYLFDTGVAAPPYAAGTGTAPVGDAGLAALRSAAGLKTE